MLQWDKIRSKWKRNCENCGESFNKSLLTIILSVTSASFNGSFNPLLSTRYEICLFEDSTWSSKKSNSARIFWGQGQVLWTKKTSNLILYLMWLCLSLTKSHIKYSIRTKGIQFKLGPNLEAIHQVSLYRYKNVFTSL